MLTCSARLRTLLKRGSILTFPVGGDVRNHTLGKCNFLDFARHIPQVIYLCHARKRILFSQAGKSPPQIKRPDCKCVFDCSRLVLDSAFANSECGCALARFSSLGWVGGFEPPNVISKRHGNSNATGKWHADVWRFAHPASMSRMRRWRMTRRFMT